MRKVVAVAFISLFSLRSVFGVVFTDPTNLVQNTISAVSDAAHYAKTVSDWKSTLAYYTTQIEQYQQQIENASGIKDAVSNFNQISKIYSDFNKTYENISSFRNEVLKDPKGFLDSKLKERYERYQIFDQCKEYGYTGEELNVCLRNKLNYVFAYDELEENGKKVKSMSQAIDELDKKLKSSKDLKESMDWQNEVNMAQLRMSQLQLKMTTMMYNKEIEKEELADKRRQLQAQQMNTGFDMAAHLAKVQQ